METKKIIAEIESKINSGLLDQAETLLVKSSINQPTKKLIQAIILGRRGDYGKSEGLLREVLLIDPNNLIAKLHLGTALVSLKKIDLARDLVDEVLEKCPQDLQVVANKALILLDEQKFQDVIGLIDPIYKTSKSPVHICALISAYRAMFDLDKTDQLLQEALERFPDAKDVQRLRADYLSEVSPLDAKKMFDELIVREPNNKAVKWNSSFVDLRLRNFEQGWTNYEFGLDPDIGKIGRPLPEMINLLPRIKDFHEIDPDKYIVICGEQGIGDQVVFMSALDDFIKMHKKTIYLADSRLLPIIRRSYPHLAAYEFGMVVNLSENTDIQGYIPVGSLMKDLRPTVDSFISKRNVFLLPNKEKVLRYRQQLKKEFPDKPIVGISWKGGFWERAQRTKTLQLDLWDSLLSRKDMSFVSLQYGDVDQDRKISRQRGYNLKFVSGIDFKKDIDSWHSLSCACDLIVSISTALVHFAGASGKKVYVLLNDRQQPFIWGLDDTKSIVYKDVHLVRKARGSDPEEFFKQLNKIFI